MEGNSNGFAILGWQLFGGTIGILALIGLLTISVVAWAFRHLWMLFRLVSLIESRKQELNELVRKCEAAADELAKTQQQIQQFRKHLPPMPLSNVRQISEKSG